MQKAIILGSSGQDGRILYKKLEGLGYEIIGFTKNKSKSTIRKFSDLDLRINSKNDVFNIVERFKPNEIYHLSAYQHSSTEVIADEENEVFNKSIEVNAKSLQIILESIRLFSKKTSLFYAASSSIFGDTETKIQNEDTPFSPIDYYGISKVTGINICEYYRNKENLNISVGIMFNHESIYRKKKFVSYKIIDAAVKIKKGEKNELVLGSLDAKVDWGAAEDYVDAMHLITKKGISENFIIATGKLHTVKDFVSIVFNYLDLDYKKYVKIKPELITKKNKSLCGDITKIKRITGWEPKIKLEEMIIKMVEEYNPED